MAGDHQPRTLLMAWKTSSGLWSTENVVVKLMPGRRSRGAEKMRRSPRSTGTPEQDQLALVLVGRHNREIVRIHHRCALGGVDVVQAESVAELVRDRDG